MHPPTLLDVIETREGKKLLPTATRRKLRQGQTLSSPARQDNSVFIVCSGKIRVHLASAQRELTLAFLEKGEVYATHTPAWVTAAQASEVLVINAHEFSGFMRQVPSAIGSVMRALGTLLGHTIEVVENLVFRDAHERLAHFLAAATRRHGQPTDGGWIVRLDLSVTEIALLLGSTRQTVSSVFNQMHRQGVVLRLGRSQLRVADLARLEAWSAIQAEAEKSSCGVAQPTDPARGPS